MKPWTLAAARGARVRVARRACGAALALAAGAVASLAHAAGDFPSHSIRMEVGFAAGGPTDVIARLLAQEMTQTLGHSVIVENKTGANSMIATKDVARAPNDGYTLLFASLSHNVNWLLLKDQAGYEPLKDFAPIDLAATLPLVLVTAYDSPLKSVSDLVNAARAKPDGLSYGSAGVGGSAHLAAAMMATTAQVKMVHVPFRGNAPALTEVMSGRVSFMFYPSIGIADNVASKRLRVLAVGSAKPMADFPGVPTMDASGFPGFEKTAPWVGLLAPAGTPKPVIDKLNAAMNAALRKPDVQKRLAELGAVIVGDTPQQFEQYLVGDQQRWADVIKAANITMQ